MMQVKITSQFLAHRIAFGRKIYSKLKVTGRFPPDLWFSNYEFLGRVDKYFLQWNLHELANQFEVTDSLASVSLGVSRLTSTTNSPLSFLFSRTASSSAGVPRRNSSNFLVSSRASTMRAVG